MPLRCTCSARGFMTDVLGLEFIKLFHNQTSHLQSEGPRLLHVDCHSSHINLPLLRFAREHNIIILGYPPHTTHLLQGLDVVLFSPFKNAYSKRSAEHLKQTGEEVEKPAFLTVLHKAVQDSFTEKNILTAWRKTGLRPVDPNIISDKELAPCKEFSTMFTLPLPPPSPIRAVVDAIHRQNALQVPYHLSAAATPSDPPVLTPFAQVSPSLFETSSNSIDQQSQDAIPTAPGSQLPSLRPSNYADPLDLLTAQVNNLSLTSSPSSSKLGNVSPVLETNFDTKTEAIYTAGEILRSLASTSLAPLLELDAITSTCELPPIERGPLPIDLLDAIKASGSIPSPELWRAVRFAFPQLIARADRLLAQAVLQETYCQQFQRKLKLKEKPRNQTSLRKVMGLNEGLIFTSDLISGALEENAKVREEERLEAEAKQTAKELKKEAKEWMEAAVARQKEVHAGLIEEWKATPSGSRRSRRQPPKPPLDIVPEEYREALKPATRQPRKKAARRGSISFSECSGSNYSD